MAQVEESGRFLIDTHCHVHVNDFSHIKKENPCVDPPVEPVARMSGDSVLGEIAVTRGLLDRGDCRDNQRHEAKLNPELERMAKDRDIRDEVLHIPMGINQDDWLRAISFAGEDLKPQGLAAKEIGKEPFIRCEAGGKSTEHPSVSFRFGVGLHPWYAHSKSEGWLRDLTALLEAHPEALVGEIGLDKVARTSDTRRVEWDDQVHVFEAQMALAARLRRPVSVHCVKAYGRIVQVLRDKAMERVSAEGATRKGTKYVGGTGRIERETKLGGSEGEGAGVVEGAHRGPPRIALHSFTGSVEVAKDLCRISSSDRSEIFFGFSVAVNMRSERERQRLLDVMKVIPESSVLIETDRKGRVGAGAELLRVCGALAEAREISLEEAVLLANSNARRFLSPTALRSMVQGAIRRKL